MKKEKPKIVCLCGSTRFWQEFQKAGLDETLKGNIVLSIGAARASNSDDELFCSLSPDEFNKVKGDLDRLHFRKIDMADEVYILNKDGYIGESTARELVYARLSGKKVKFLEPCDIKLKRVIVVESEEGTLVFDAKLYNVLEDVRILVEEGGIGDSITLTVREVEEGMMDKLPLD